MELKGLSIYLDQEGHKLMARLTPEGDAEMITLTDFKRVVDTAGFGECDLNEDALLEATSNYIEGKPFEILLGNAVDGDFYIKIDNNHLNAYLTVIPPRGGDAVTPLSITNEARDKSITVDINMEAVELAIRENAENILIASGKAAINGSDVKFESLIPNIKERAPQINEEGIADFRDLGGILFVNVGDPLMRRSQASLGQPGLTLSGQSISAKMGKNIDFAAGLEGVEIDPNNTDLLIAKIAGCPYLMPNGVRIEPTYTIKDVDLHTGNIDFPGTVNVTGEVHSGMTIKAGGDIHIKGSVEAVILIAKGDITVGGGIIGHSERTETDHHIHSKVECGGSCSANFTQNAHISTDHGIFIRDYTMMSELTAGHQVIVGDKTHKGHIIGGVTTAGLLIKAKVIGSPTRSKTIVVARASNTLYARIGAVSESRDAVKVRRVKVVKLLELAALKPGHVSVDAIKSAEFTLSQIESEIAALDLNEEELHKEIVASQKARIVAELRFLEGVEVRFGSKRMTTIMDRERGTYRLSHDELIFE